MPAPIVESAIFTVTITNMSYSNGDLTLTYNLAAGAAYASYPDLSAFSKIRLYDNNYGGSIVGFYTAKTITPAIGTGYTVTFGTSSGDVPIADAYGSPYAADWGLYVTTSGGGSYYSDITSFYSFTVEVGGGGGGGGGGPVVCFLADAPVLTPAGYKPIASLREGDMVTTADGRAVAIERVSVTRVPAPSAAVNPYVIKKGQFGATANLSISPRHRVAVPGKGMVEARELGLKQQEMAGAFDYYNLELPSWKSDNMVVAGVEVESLAPVRRMVVSAAGLKQLLAGKTLDAAAVARLRSVIRPVAGGFEVPLLKKSATK
jgi:hypothetical protein